MYGEQELIRLLDGQFFKSPIDIPVVNDETVSRRSWVEVRMTADNYQHLQALREEHVRNFRITTRSRAAQTFLDVMCEDTIKFHADNFMGSQQRLLGGEPVSSSARMRNWNGHLIQIEGDQGAYRFYYEKAAKKLEGGDLENAIGFGVKISGELGKDWRFLTNDQGKKVGVEMALDAEEFKYYLPSRHPILLRVPTGSNYRKEIDRQMISLSEISPRKDQYLAWVAQTKNAIKLERGYNALVVPKLKSPSRSKDLPHTYSRLMDGCDDPSKQQTNHVGRLEFVGRSGDLPNWAGFVVYENR